MKNTSLLVGGFFLMLSFGSRLLAEDIRKQLAGRFLIVNEISPDLDGDGTDDLILFLRAKDAVGQVEGPTKDNLSPTQFKAFLTAPSKALVEVFESSSLFDDLSNTFPGGFTLAYDAMKKGFWIRVEGGSDDGFVITMKFRWEINDFRLIGSTVEASPRVPFGKDEAGREVLGRLRCKQDTNWLTGDRIQEIPDAKSRKERKKTSTLKSKDRPARFLRADMLKFEPDYLDSFCGL